MFLSEAVDATLVIDRCACHVTVVCFGKLHLGFQFTSRSGEEVEEVR